jgi:acetoin utilization deacetylase AcuC-like enzyme
MVQPTPVVSSDDCLRHDPQAEIWVGVRTAGTEVAARVAAIRDAAVSAGLRQVDAVPHDDAILSRVHSAELLAYLRSSWQQWESSGLLDDPGQDRVVPYFVPMAEMRSGLPLRDPVAVHARAGAYCYDTMTLIGPGTWEAARASVDVALTAVDLV